MRPLIVATLLGLALAAPAHAREQVDIPVSGGATLHASIFRPAGSGKVPVVVVAGPYGTGEADTAALDTGAPPGLVDEGIAVLNVSVRGTGCSSGQWDPWSPQEARDVADVIAWAARQPWSSGHVGMAGVSYLGTSQLLAAELQPPALDAIAPIVPVGDVYRDVARPGGVLDLRVPTLFVGVPAGAYDGACRPDQDPATGWMTTTPIAQQLDGSDYRARSAVENAARIRAATLVTVALQDDTVRTGGVEVARRLTAPNRLIVTAGLHDTPARIPLVQQRVTQWLTWWLRDRFATSAPVVAGPVATTGVHRRARTARSGRRLVKRRSARRAVPRQAGTDPLRATPPVTALYELASRDLVAGLATGFAAWPPAGTRKQLPLGSGSDVMLTLGASASRESSPTQPPFAVRWTLPALDRTTVLTGDASLHLQVMSTAGDADLFAVLSEVRPDGAEVPFARAPLRLALRAVDPARSRPGAPFHPFDALSYMPAGVSTGIDIGLGPVAKVLRAGSRLKVTLTAPPLGDPVDGTSYAPSTTDLGGITIDRAASHLDLPVVDTPGQVPPRPACGATVGEVCGAQ